VLFSHLLSQDDFFFRPHSAAIFSKPRALKASGGLELLGLCWPQLCGFQGLGDLVC